jgi:hypothetical protein
MAELVTVSKSSLAGGYYNPMNLGIFELISTTGSDMRMKFVLRDFACISTLRLIKDILCGDLNLLVCQVLLHNEEIKSWRRDDDLNGRVELGSIDSLDKGLGAAKQPIYLRQKWVELECGSILILKFYNTMHQNWQVQ